MAERRMFAKTIVASDAFLDMPLSARCLYFALGMYADDEGFVNSVKSIMRLVGASTDDKNILLVRHFIIEFQSGVCLIKHWRINNYLRSDRFQATKYTEERNQVVIGENGAYVLVDERYTNGIPNNGIPSIDKDSIGKVSIDISNVGQPDGKQSFLNEIKEIIDYLNAKLGTKYKYSSKKNQLHIKARLIEGFTFDDFKKVIDKKSAKWLNTQMAEYLRPETLFGTKFEGYLNEPTIGNDKAKPQTNGSKYNRED
ncbi:MAG: conserved phage C-terminal domain-containing protein [Clostridia bacterium]|nr:conserved phage C-terminal domain-containing protein [Clostridia bacterium]